LRGGNREGPVRLGFSPGRGDVGLMRKRVKSGLLCGLLVVAALRGSGICAEPETVTVEPQTQRQVIEQQISTFVSSITMLNREDALLRWHRAICPAVVGCRRLRMTSCSLG